MKTNFDEAINIIYDMLDYQFPPDDPDNDEPRFKVNQAIWCLQNGYLLVEWPQSQEFMEEDWFDKEAILALGTEDKVGGSAYFIPIKYLI